MRPIQAALLTAAVLVSEPGRAALPATTPSPSCPDRGPGLTPSREFMPGVDLVHHSRVREAAVLFEQLAARRPDDPAPAFFQAHAIWWDAVFTERLGHLPPAFETAIEKVLRIAGDRTDPDTSLWVGSACVLRAQMLARARQPLRAGSDARRGKRALERAARDPCLPDAGFGLGAYNYYADRLGALVKGLRALLFIPGGNAELGLRQVAAAAERGTWTRLEAHLLLALIFTSPEEENWAQALLHARAAHALLPRAPTPTLALAALLDDTGRDTEAAALYDTLLGDSSLDFTDHADGVTGVAADRRARQLIRALRPRAAAAVLGVAVRGGSSASHPAMERARALHARLRFELGEDESGPPPGLQECERGWLVPIDAAASSGFDGPEATARWRALERVHPCGAVDPQRRHWALGAGLLRAGEPVAARTHLEPAATGPDADIQGWSLLLLAELDLSAGETRAAARRLTSAAGLRGFRHRVEARWRHSQFEVRRPQ